MDLHGNQWTTHIQISLLNGANYISYFPAAKGLVSGTEIPFHSVYMVLQHLFFNNKSVLIGGKPATFA